MENGLITVQDAVRMYDEAEDASREERDLAEQCRDYYDGKQLTDDELATLRKRGQPEVVSNKIKPKVDFLRGFMAQQMVAPKALPRTPVHEEESHAVTDALRYVVDNTEFDEIDEMVFEERAIEGIGAVEFSVVAGRSGPEIQANRIPWDRYTRDPHSRRADFKDATYHIYITWMDKEEADQIWPDATEAIGATIDSYAGDETFEDRPHWQIWADGKRQRVKVVRLWFKKKGQWCWCTFTRNGFLDEPAPSPYLDEDGMTMCPIVVQSAYTDRENRRYGIVRDMLSPQDEYNKRRSKALHHLNSRQTMGDKGAVESVARMKRELAAPDGHVEVIPDKRFEMLGTGDLSAGQFALMEQSGQELEAMGPNASLLGKEDKELSGRAIRAQQQGGMIEISGLTSGQRSWRKRSYRVMWNMIRQFWRQERWIRVTDNENGLRFVGLNQPVTVKDVLAEQGQMIPAEMSMDPRLDQVVGVRNNVGELDVDIILEEGHDPLTTQEDNFENVLRLAELYNGQGQPFPVDILAEMVPNLRNRDALLERLRGGQQAEVMAAQQQEHAAMAQQMDLAQREADIRKTHAEAAEEESRAVIQQAQIGWLQ